MQACDGDAAVATFSELDENASTGITRSCSTSSDLGISVWGGRYVGDFISIRMVTRVVYLVINQSINQHEIAMAPYIQSSGAPEMKIQQHHSVTIMIQRRGES